MKISIEKSGACLNDTLIKDCKGFQSGDGTIYLFSEGHQHFMRFYDTGVFQGYIYPEIFENPCRSLATLEDFLAEFENGECDNTLIVETLIEDFEIKFFGSR